MHRLLLLALLCATTVPAAAQPFTFDEAFRGGGSSSDTGEGIALAADGSRTVVGTFEGTATFGDVSVTSAGDSDFFLVKYDADGEAVWARRGGTDVFNDFGTATAIAVDGSVYATGFFTGIATFDGGANPDVSLTTFSDFDVFLVKYDTEGDLQWVRQAGGTEQDTGRDLAIDADGNVYLVGGFEGTGTFGSVVLTSAGSTDAFLAKYTPDGTVLWARRGGSDQGDLAYGIAVTADGAAHLSGSFRGVAQFGSLPVQSAGSSDVFVVQYDTEGQPVWVEGIGADGSEFTRGGGIGLGPDGEVYVQGSFSNTILIGSDVLASTGFTDIFVAKLDSDGNELWGRRGGGDGTNFSAALAVDASGNALAVGYADGTGTFDDTPITTQGRDGYFAVFDAEGDLVTVGLLGGTGQDASTGVAANDALGRFAATGSFRGTATFGGFELTSAGSSDIFVLGGPTGAPPAPSTLYVDADATGTETGLSWADAFTDLQDALTLAATNDADSLAIWVAEGTYYPTDDDDRTVSFELQSGLALYGGFDGTETLLDERDLEANETILGGDIGMLDDFSDNSYHVVRADDLAASALIDGFTVTEGTADGGKPDLRRGAGLFVQNSELRIANSFLTSNRVGASSVKDNNGRGAGLYADPGSEIELSNVAITDNVAAAFSRGAGLYSAGNALLNNVSITGNTGGQVSFGAGMYNGGSAALTAVTFRDNTLGSDGAAALQNEGDVSIRNSLFENNRLTSSGATGGIRNGTNASCSIFGSTFTNNSGSLAGVMLNGFGSSVEIANSQFIRNSGGNSAVLFNDRADVTVYNSVFVGNTAGEAGGSLDDGASSIYANVLFAGNLGCGSAIKAENDAVVRVVNAVVASNDESNGCFGSGGALLFEGFPGDADSATLTNLILWENAPTQIVTPPGIVDARRAIIEGGFEGMEILEANPTFVRNPDPGADGEWGTEDDDYGDLRLQEGSPAVDFGRAEFLPPDTFDLDGDGDTEEPLPLDLDGNPRVQGNEVDLGAYESPFAVALEPGAGTPTQNGLGAAYPNPFGQRTTLALDVSESQTVKVEVFDVLGRRVATVHDGPLAVGAHRIVIEAVGLPAGVYIVRAEGEAFRFAQRVTLVR